jgi:hypothetical protein
LQIVDFAKQSQVAWSPMAWIDSFSLPKVGHLTGRGFFIHALYFGSIIMVVIII